MTENKYQYDVALSFAGEDRHYVDEVAKSLTQNGIKVFYDRHEEIDLWGKDLYTHLDEIYRLKARYCVIFISASYKNKLWTNHERESAQARAFKENKEYILPARFDDTKIPGIKPTIGYVDLRTLSPKEFASKVLQKIGKIGKVDIPEPGATDTGFRRPKMASQSFNPYDEALSFIDFLSKELKRRCSALLDQGVSLSVFERNGRKCFRVVVNGEPTYSLDVWMDDTFGNASISFYGVRGSGSRISPNSSNAWGNIVWSKDSGAPVLELHDLSLLRHLTDSRQYTYMEFLNSLWDKICDVLEKG